jgi:hypothetical protein
MKMGMDKTTYRGEKNLLDAILPCRLLLGSVSGLAADRTGWRPRTIRSSEKAMPGNTFAKKMNCSALARVHVSSSDVNVNGGLNHGPMNLPMSKGSPDSSKHQSNH